MVHTGWGELLLLLLGTNLLLQKTRKHTQSKTTCSGYLLHQQMMLLLIHWEKAAMQVDLVDEHQDAKDNPMDAVKHGFGLDNIQSIVKLYIEH